jgi:hypothetical protein
MSSARVAVDTSAFCFVGGLNAMRYMTIMTNSWRSAVFVLPCELAEQEVIENKQQIPAAIKGAARCVVERRVLCFAKTDARRCIDMEGSI